MTSNDKRQLQNILIAVILVGACFIGFWYFRASLYISDSGELITTHHDFLPVTCSYQRANSLDFSEGRAMFYSGYARLDVYIKEVENKYYRVHGVLTPDLKFINWLDDKSLGAIDVIDPNSSGGNYGLDPNGTWHCSPWWIPSRAVFAVPSDVTYSHSDK